MIRLRGNRGGGRFAKDLFAKAIRATAWSTNIVAERLDVSGGLSQENLTAPDPSQVLSDFHAGLTESPSDQGAFF